MLRPRRTRNAEKTSIMCGIAGWWERGSRATRPDVLDSMLDSIAHRGPDDRGIWREGPLALGHVRLTILDTSARAHQPFVTADGEGVGCARFRLVALEVWGRVFLRGQCPDELGERLVACRSSRR